MFQVYKRTKKKLLKREKKKATYDFMVDQYHQCYQPQCHQVLSILHHSPFIFEMACVLIYFNLIDGNDYFSEMLHRDSFSNNATTLYPLDFLFIGEIAHSTLAKHKEVIVTVKTINVPLCHPNN